MRKLTLILLGTLAMAVSTLVMAVQETKSQKGDPQVEEHISDQGELNANSPSGGDQLKGEERAEERQAMEPENQGKHTAKGKTEGKQQKAY